MKLNTYSPVSEKQICQIQFSKNNISIQNLKHSAMTRGFGAKCSCKCFVSTATVNVAVEF